MSFWPGAYRLWRAGASRRCRASAHESASRAGRPRPQTRRRVPNQVWAYDFVFDAGAPTASSSKCLTVTDEWTKEGLGDRGRRPYPLAPRDRGAVAAGVASAARPLYLRSDNGPEFVSRALLTWIVDQGIATALIDPGKPWQNGATESFNGKFRDECLSLEWFRSRAEAKIVIENWRRHFNTVRPHSSLDYVRDWLPIRRERCGSRGSRTSRW